MWVSIIVYLIQQVSVHKPKLHPFYYVRTLKLMPMEMGLGVNKFWLRIVQLSTPPNHQIVVLLLGMCFELCVCVFFLWRTMTKLFGEID
jgi:hypothetical protein